MCPAGITHSASKAGEDKAWLERHSPSRGIGKVFPAEWRKPQELLHPLNSSHLITQPGMHKSLFYRNGRGMQREQRKPLPTLPHVRQSVKDTQCLSCHLERSLIHKIRSLNILHHDWLHHFEPLPLFFSSSPPLFFQYLESGKSRKPFILSGVVYCPLVTQ